MRTRILLVFVTAAVVGVVVSLFSSKDSDTSRLNDIAKIRLRGDHQKAVEELNDYLEDFPRHAQGWTILGNSLRDLGRDDDAEQAYDRALAIDPGQLQSLVGKGALCRRRGDLEQAEAHYLQVLDAAPSHAQAHGSLAVVALKRGRKEKALEYARKAYAADAEDPIIAANLAVAWHYAGDTEKRDEMTRKAEQLGYGSVEKLQKIYAGELTVLGPPETDR